MVSNSSRKLEILPAVSSNPTADLENQSRIFPPLQNIPNINECIFQFT